MNLAHGKISLTIDPDVVLTEPPALLQQTLFVAAQDTRIECMLFVLADSGTPANLNLWIQYEDDTIRLLNKDYSMPADEKEFTRYLYLKKYEKILATSSVSEAIEYHINGSLKVMQTETITDNGEEYNIEVEVPGGYGYNYGENYGE